MKPPNYEAAQLMPLISDIDIECRVAELIGRANVRQLWFLFLDESDVQLPLLIPVDGLPTEPTNDHTAAVLRGVRELMDEIHAVRVVFVWERYGAARLTAQDAAWVASLREGCDDAGIPLRAILLSHRTGVRWVAQDDYSVSTPHPDSTPDSV